MIHLAAHGEDLAAHLLGQSAPRLALCASASASQHGERRFEKMRQIGNMGAGAAHHFLAVLDQGIEFGGQRRDLGGEFSFQPARLAVADAGQRPC